MACLHLLFVGYNLEVRIIAIFVIAGLWRACQISLNVSNVKFKKKIRAPG